MATPGRLIAPSIVLCSFLVVTQAALAQNPPA
jgi:hypothetical protein